MREARQYKVKRVSSRQKYEELSKRLSKENAKKRKEREKKIRLISSIIIYSACFLMIFAFFYILLERNEVISKKKSNLIDLQQEIEVLELEKDNIKAKISTNLDLKIIETKAKKELKMVYPTANQTQYIIEKWKYSLDEAQEEKVPIVHSAKKNK